MLTFLNERICLQYSSDTFLHLQLFQELANREEEYLVLSRDTTEGDIKQRREISAGEFYLVIRH